MAATFTALAGTLVRCGRHSWQWKDGRAAPYVTDLSPAELWDLGGRGPADGPTHVEIPRGRAFEHDELAWVLEAAVSGRFQSEAGTILVPIAEWEAWEREHPAGAYWDRINEPAVLERAYALGWRPPAGFQSRSGWKVPHA